MQFSFGKNLRKIRIINNQKGKIKNAELIQVSPANHRKPKRLFHPGIFFGFKKGLMKKIIYT
jgi:hypothetical protein